MRARNAILLLACVLTVPYGALAKGTARITQFNGAVRTYENVRIAIENKQMTITSSDGVGTLVIQKASCDAVGKLLRCYPYAAELRQRGETQQIPIQAGSAWLNPGRESAQLPQSSTQLPPHGVLMSIRTKAGTYFNLNGTVDQLKR